uniref:high affinity immunoglobulin alpha and immunoglobulin mu Fc receptor n=1 Tax=Jaculus jaculus TaxID=51337 RepID=UPI001E1B4090|nr:high affinity immunoglobulin alpha and immunoglobulin mu Fc receptor [Jaculus jaculus]
MESCLPRVGSSDPASLVVPAQSVLSELRSHSEKATCRRTGRILHLVFLCLLHGSSLTLPQRRPHFRQQREGSLPFKIHLRNMTTCTPPCWWEESSFAASGALRGPSLVSGEAGGAVTIQCHYAPSSVNRHQRKYWCRLEPPLRVCRTIVSTNHYAHRDYCGRVALTDFPRRGLFTVKLFQVSLDDAGQYRCGIGNRNNALFVGVTLNVSAGPFNTIYTAPPDPGNVTLASFGTTSPIANKWTSAATQPLEGQASEWDSKATPLAKGRETPGTVQAAASGAGSRVEGSIKTTVPTPESPALKLRSMPTTTEGVWIWGTQSSLTKTASTSEHGRKKTSTEDERPGEETEVRVILDTARKTTGTIRPSTLSSEHVARVTLPEGTVISKQQMLASKETSSSAPGAWTWGSLSIEASVEGSSDGSLENTAGESRLPGMPSQPPAEGSTSSPGKGPSMKSAFPEEKSNSWILTTVSTILSLVLLLTVVLLQRRFWRRRSSPEAEREPRVTLIQVIPFLNPNLLPDQLPDVGRNLLQSDTPPPKPPLLILLRPYEDKPLELRFCLRKKRPAYYFGTQKAKNSSQPEVEVITQILEGLKIIEDGPFRHDQL